MNYVEQKHATIGKVYGLMTKGNDVYFHVVFYDESGEVYDPDTVTLTIQKGDETIITPSVSKTSTGQYQAKVLLDVAGRWFYQWTGSGTRNVLEQGSVYVRGGLFS